MGRGSRQGAVSAPRVLSRESEADQLFQFIESDLSARQRIEIFADPRPPYYLPSQVGGKGHRRVQGEVAMRNYLGKLFDQENLPPEIAAIVEREREWMNGVLRDLPEPSWRHRIGSIFSEQPPDYLRARWADAVLSIDNSSAAGKYLLRYLRSENSSQKPEDWFRNPPDESRMWDQLLLIESQRAVRADPELQELQDDLLRETGRLRDEAAVCGRRPDPNLFLVPHSGWTSVTGNPLTLAPDLLDHEEDMRCGIYSNGRSFVFGSTISRLARLYQKGEAIENVLHAARHELIHSVQPRETEAASWQWDVREALTEALNVHRSYSPYREDPGYISRKSLPHKTSYQFEVTVLEKMLLPHTTSEQWGEWLDRLNGSSMREIDKQLDPLFGGSFGDAWKAACQLERALYE